MWSATGHQHGEAIEAEGNAPVRWRAELECIEQEAEFLLRLLRRDPEQLEHRGLHLLAVDAHRAAADLRAVQHQVVGTREQPRRAQRRAPPGHRRGAR